MASKKMNDAGWGMTTLVGDVEISSCWLGGVLPYETMVFGGTMDGETRKYSTRQEALAGHAAMVAEVGSVPSLSKVSEPVQVAAKVERLAENLKHLDKPDRRETPRRSWAYDTTHACYIQGFYWGRKVAGGRNKLSGNFGRYDMRVERELDALTCDTRPSRFFEGEMVRTPRQSQAIRDGYCHWFPVALENTTYSDAIARHFAGALQAGLRAVWWLLPYSDRWLHSKYSG